MSPRQNVEKMKIPSYLCSVRRRCLTVVVVFFVIESLVLNTVVLLFMASLQSMVSNILNAPGDNLLDKLSSNPLYQNFVSFGKEGGFKNLVEHTVGRLYVENNCVLLYHQKTNTSKQNHVGPGNPSISKIAVDVSNAGEALYIMRRIEARFTTPFLWNTLVVDIGANDGFMSSNSYNFIQCGWSAILVEPQNYQLDLARKNLNGLTNQHEAQKVHFVQGVVSDRDGSVNFKLSQDLVSMESHIVSSKTGDQAVVTVQSYSVKTLASKYAVPKHFGILSIDAEGYSNKILYEWLKLGFRPQFIIYEALHESEPVAATVNKLGSYQYTYMVQKGWNHIFEYNGNISDS